MQLAQVDSGGGITRTATGGREAVPRPLPVPGVAATYGDELAEIAARACSFSGATLVLMADGTKRPIDQIEVGDEVIATDPETGEQAAKWVEHVFVHDDNLTDLNNDPVTRSDPSGLWVSGGSWTSHPDEMDWVNPGTGQRDPHAYNPVDPLGRPKPKPPVPKVPVGKFKDIVGAVASVATGAADLVANGVQGRTPFSSDYNPYSTNWMIKQFDLDPLSFLWSVMDAGMLLTSLGTLSATKAGTAVGAARSGSAGAAAKGGSRLAEASSAAFCAADDPASMFIKNKHLASAGGNGAKFATDDIGQVQGWISRGLKSDGVQFLPNGLDDTFRAIVPAGRAVGTRGQTNIRVIVTNDGRVINAFPVNVR